MKSAAKTAFILLIVESHYWKKKKKWRQIRRENTLPWTHLLQKNFGFPKPEILITNPAR
jgi:hypothetical protein